MIRRIVTIIILLSAILKAQPEFDYSGYFLDLPIYQVSPDKLAEYYSSDKTQFINLSRLRIRPEIFF